MGQLITAFARTDGQLWFTIDETLERREGRRIVVAGWFRDAVRSTEGRTVTARGVRWLVLSLVVRPRWSTRVWSLPIVCVIAPAPIERQKLNRPRNITGGAQRMLYLLRKWFPDRELVLLADGGYFVHELYRRSVRLGVTLITRGRGDMMLHAPYVAPAKRCRGRQWTHGPRLPHLRDTIADPATVWTPMPDDTRETAVVDGHWHPGRKQANPVPVRCVMVRERATAARPAGGARVVVLLPGANKPRVSLEWVFCFLVRPKSIPVGGHRLQVLSNVCHFRGGNRF